MSLADAVNLIFVNIGVPASDVMFLVVLLMAFICAAVSFRLGLIMLLFFEVSAFIILYTFGLETIKILIGIFITVVLLSISLWLMASRSSASVYG